MSSEIERYDDEPALITSVRDAEYIAARFARETPFAEALRFAADQDGRPRLIGVDQAGQVLVEMEYPRRRRRG